MSASVFRKKNRSMSAGLSVRPYLQTGLLYRMIVGKWGRLVITGMEVEVEIRGEFREGGERGESCCRQYSVLPLVKARAAFYGIREIFREKGPFF